LTEHDENLERVIDTLKEPVTIDPNLDARIMAIVEQLPKHSRPWFARRWTVRVSPLGGLAAAAAVAAIALATSLLTRANEQTPAPIQATSEAAPVTQFVLVAPNAKSVTLVGDFNDWSLSATRLARQAGDGVWWVTVNLPPGRYRYAFVVDGTTWRSDPNAPAAEDDFGRPNSVVTIGGA
jgi:hypothetical protein